MPCLALAAARPLSKAPRAAGLARAKRAVWSKQELELLADVHAAEEIQRDAQRQAEARAQGLIRFENVVDCPDSNEVMVTVTASPVGTGPPREGSPVPMVSHAPLLTQGCAFVSETDGNGAGEGGGEDAGGVRRVSADRLELFAGVHMACDGRCSSLDKDSLRNSTGVVPPGTSGHSRECGKEQQLERKEDREVVPQCLLYDRRHDSHEPEGLSSKLDSLSL